MTASTGMLANPDRAEIYKVTEALIALYAALKERNHCELCDGEGLRVIQRYGGPDCVACTCTKDLQSVEAKFLSIFVLAERHKGTPASDGLYSILAPGSGLCRCLDAVQRLHAAAVIRESCTTCRGMGRSFRYDWRLDKTQETRCACATAVDAALEEEKHRYQAALGAWMEWRGVDETPSTARLLELIVKGG